MAKKFKQTPGGYVVMPVSIMKSRKLNMNDKVMLCYLIGFWLNCPSVVVSESKVMLSTGMSIDEVRESKSRLVEAGLIQIGEKRKTYNGPVESITINPVTLNGFFGCDLLDRPQTNPEKTSGTAVPAPSTERRTILSSIDSDYYKMRDKVCRP